MITLIIIYRLSNHYQFSSLSLTCEARRHLGSGPHSMRIEMFEHGGGAGMIFRYKGADTANKMIVVPETAMRKRGGGAGFKEEVFYFSQKGHCGNLKNRKPKMVRTVQVVVCQNIPHSLFFRLAPVALKEFFGREGAPKYRLSSS